MNFSNTTLFIWWYFARYYTAN